MKIYLVGGAIRDNLLNFPVKERDWLVIGSTPENMIKNGYKRVGKYFPVFLNPKTHEEYALARMEYKINLGHKGFAFFSSPNVTLKEDLYRRDLTINAIAQDINGKIIDPYNGKKDIKLKILRHISNSFKEDPLRVLRVARLAAKFFHLKFKIAKETFNLMKLMSKELNYLSAERIWKETEKALNTNNPHIYFKILYECYALKILFPEFYSLFKIQEINYNNKKINSGMHTILSIKIASKLSKDIVIRFSALCHDFGKILFLNKKFIEYHDYVSEGIKLLELFCKRLKIPNFLKKAAKIVIKYHIIINNIFCLSSKEILKLLYSIDVWRHKKILKQVIISSESDIKSFLQYNKKCYYQGIYLTNIYNIVKKINASSIIKEGICGYEISKKLFILRNNAIKKLCKNKKFYF
ncbi:multifunctional CCA addition/repair protein [Sodalis-like secondary symbiont of Drepanosiphum platanoidis]|uniref:multifunctional CCA addition/repair protein n=1 Tax=Sodalis-like secondary symbiont of Drepanosiphum platanoidis TaxID=2994493 RepID=UPI003463AE4D